VGICFWERCAECNLDTSFWHGGCRMRDCGESALFKCRALLCGEIQARFVDGRNMTQPLPNFFILGAPKCGTTSVANWLADHPQVFMSPVKEPNYFCTDFPRATSSSCGNLREYISLFRGGGGSPIIGEASVWYLFSSIAVLNIEAFRPEPKYLVLLRNPIELAQALHRQLYYTLDEDVQDFESAWSMQAERLIGKHLPPHCRMPQSLQYGAVCSLGTQLKRLLNAVPRHRVKTLILEDIKRDPRQEWLALQDFLGLEDDARQFFPAHNIAKRPRSAALRKARVLVGRKLRDRFGSLGGFGLLRKLDVWNTRPMPQEPLTAAFRLELANFFDEEIGVLESLLERDLTCWKNQ